MGRPATQTGAPATLFQGTVIAAPGVAAKAAAQAAGTARGTRAARIPVITRHAGPTRACDGTTNWRLASPPPPPLDFAHAPVRCGCGCARLHALARAAALAPLGLRQQTSVDPASPSTVRVARHSDVAERDAAAFRADIKAFERARAAVTNGLAAKGTGAGRRSPRLPRARACRLVGNGACSETGCTELQLDSDGVCRLPTREHAPSGTAAAIDAAGPGQ